MKHKTPERKAIEKAIQASTARGESTSIQELSVQLRIAIHTVRKAIQNLQAADKLHTIKSAGNRSARYLWVSYKLTQPTNGPGYTPMKWAQGAISNTDAIKPPAEKPLRNGTTSGNWIAPKWELARPGAEDHKQHGSRRGDEVQEWCPPLSMCTGKGVERFMPDRLQR